MTGGVSSLLWFVAIVALIPLALWMLKRTPMGGGASGQMIRSIAALPLSANQRIVTIEVGTGEARRWLVLGVTPGGISTLHTMEPQEAAMPPTTMPAMPGFAQLLARLQPKKEDDVR